MSKLLVIFLVMFSFIGIAYASLTQNQINFLKSSIDQDIYTMQQDNVDIALDQTDITRRQADIVSQNDDMTSAQDILLTQANIVYP